MSQVSTISGTGLTCTNRA